MGVHPFNLISICSGIGGLDLGVSMAVPGARTVCYVEREGACIEILASRMDEGHLHPAPIWTDAKTFDGCVWAGRVHGILSGYPCQPFSVAGKRRGEQDERHLWPDIKRVIAEVGPEFVFLENVPGHIRMGLDTVLADLDEIGFDAEWGTLRASDLGAPHKRERLFILAYRHGQRGSGWRDAADLVGAAREAQGEAQEWERCGDAADHCKPDVADASGERLQGGQQREALHGDGDRPQAHGSAAQLRRASLHGESASVDPVPMLRELYLQHPQAARTRLPLPSSGGVAERSLLTWPPTPDADWSGIDQLYYPSLEPDVLRMANGVPSRMDKLRALGNAVVPACAAEAFIQLARRIP